MADPLSILGGVAASIQLVEYATGTLVGTIKLVRDIRDIPKKTATSLEDVERSSKRVNYVCRDILGIGSLAADCIEPGILSRLLSGCDGLRLAIDDAATVLRPILEGFDSSKHKAAYRLWNTVVTKARESAILEKLQRLDKLNLELIGDFNIANLSVQLDLRSALMENSVATQRHRLESSNGLNNLTESSAEAHSTLRSMICKTDHLTSDVNNLAETTRSIHHETARFGSEMQTQFRLSHDDMGRMMRYHETRMSTELRSIRDELIVAITAAGNRSSTRTVELGLGHLSKQDGVLLQSGIAYALMHKPKSLRDAWDFSNRNASFFESCACCPKARASSSKVWNVHFSSLQRDDHREGCPFHLSGTHSWSYSMSANLRPFLNKVVDISLGATTGSGTWTIFPSLRFSKISERSKSPVFLAFDNIVDLCTSRKVWSLRSGVGRQYHWNDNFSQKSHSQTGCFELEWLPCTGEQLRDLNTLLQNQMKCGEFSGAEEDENGFTVLFEFCNLVTLLGRQGKQFEAQLRCLLQTILKSQVNVLATTVFDESLRHYRIGALYDSVWASKQITAIEYLIERGIPMLRQEIPFYDELLRGGVIDGLESASSSNNRTTVTDLYQPSGFGFMSPCILIHHVEVAEALEYDDLALAVINRSINDVKSLASKACLDGTMEKFCNSRRTYMELALGWTEGMQCLLSKGFTAAPAIHSACSSRDVASLSILLTSKEAIFSTTLDWQPSWIASPLWTLREAIDSGSQEILGLMLFELRKRNGRPSEDVSEIYSKDGTQRISTTETSVLAEKCDTTLPDLGSTCCARTELECWRAMSPYCFDATNQDFRDRTSSIRSYADILNAVYGYGFTNIDQADETKETPMFRLVRRSFRQSLYSDNLFHEGDIVEWFLAHGANVTDQTRGGWPNILFYLAFCGSINLRSWKIDEWEGKQTRAVLKRLQMTRDMCKCFCASSGCLPVHLVLRCFYRSKRDCVQATGRTQLLRRWMQRWDILDDEMETLTMETVRLELFERLGMAHTCCRQTWQSPNYWNSPFEVDRLPDSDVQSLQNDDSELNDQLEVFLAHFKLWKLEAQNFSGALEEIWWKTVDEILPPLTPDECNQRHWLYVSNSAVMKDPEISRGEREKEALRKNGFAGFDFKEVIGIYLSKRRVELVKERGS